MRLPASLLLVVPLGLATLCAQEAPVAPPAPETTTSTGKDEAPQAPRSPQDPPSPATPPKPQSMQEALASFEPKKGRVPVGDQARVNLADGWLWLADTHATRFLVQLGNPEDASVLGIAIPPDFETSGTFAVYSYADEGYVDDDEQPNFDELLAKMQERANEESNARRAAGMPTVQLLGWAEPPHYDLQQHKLYWAERLKFGDSETETLNYNVRILGRSGYLVVQGVGHAAQLQVVSDHCKSLLVATEFVEGRRYENFDPAYDKVAAYGIGGLVAGKLALKAGLFAKLLLLLKGFAKPILIGLLAIGAVVVKFFSRRQAATAGAAPSNPKNPGRAKG